MPFVSRVVTPCSLSRIQLHDSQGRPTINEDELEAVTNFTLSNALKQLASVLLIAKDIFDNLNHDLTSINSRSIKIREKINLLQHRVEECDPKSVTVPEGNMTWYSTLSVHYESKKDICKDLFTVKTRPTAIIKLYESAAEKHMKSVKAHSLTVTPVLGSTRRRAQAIVDEIDMSKPALVVSMRRWTSLEVLGDLTVEPDITIRVNLSTDLVDHTLPSPEEQLTAIANKFPAELVTVDISGKTFQRMTNLRRSLVHVEYDDSVRRRKGKRPKGKRRNTIAGTDSKELEAIVSESSETVVKLSPENVAEKKSHLGSLKEWGLGRLRQLKQTDVKLRINAARKWEDAHPNSSSGNWSASSESGHSTTTSHHPRSSISSGSTYLKHRRPVIVSTSSSITSESTITPDDFETGSMYSCDTEGYYTSFHLDSGLKPLREEDPCPALQSTSALSQSVLTGDSEYELFGHGSTSTTASSAGTVCTALIGAPVPPARSGSQLSGNKTFPERSRPIANTLTYSLRIEKSSDLKPVLMDQNEQRSELTKENLTKHNCEPENGIITVDVHAVRNGAPEKCGDSPDSGHNTCSSPVDSLASPSIDMEMSEYSDIEGIDRAERIRVKTTINSSRIPSMCVITPPQSDDEVGSLQHTSTVAIDSGDYVTIAEIKPARPLEFVSLNELCSDTSLKNERVNVDSQGKIVYSSESLKRKKKTHTTGTFEPGVYVAENSSSIFGRAFSVRSIKSPAATKKTSTNKVLNKKNCSSFSIAPSNLPGQKILSKIKFDRLPGIKNTFWDSSAPDVEGETSMHSKENIENKSHNSAKASPLVSRGGYVRMQQPTDDLSFSPLEFLSSDKEHNLNLVKRSDSYRLANQEVFNPNTVGRKQYGPSVFATPSLLSALSKTSKVLPDPVANDGKEDTQSSSPVCKESPKPQSTSTPTKTDSPHLDFTTVPSPIGDKSPSRSAMDLFAIIHDSKKKIQSLQIPKKDCVEWPKTIPGKAMIPRPMNNIEPKRYTLVQYRGLNDFPSKQQFHQEVVPPQSFIQVHLPKLQYNSFPRMKIVSYDESPRNILRRKQYSPLEAAASRNDFKKLLLESSKISYQDCQSAVDRLKNPKFPSFCVLSSTIGKDCRGDESQFKSQNPQNEILQARASPTLETSL